jgi:uncharacterized membrane protein YeaQ/YmgE (transglycosylase-associated protein family)
MYIIAFVVVGLVAGVVASVVMRPSNVGILRYILFGIVGAFVGGLVFGELGWHAPFPGIVGVTAIAAVGAVGVLWLAWFFTGAIRKPQ